MKADDDIPQSVLDDEWSDDDDDELIPAIMTDDENIHINSRCIPKIDIMRSSTKFSEHNYCGDEAHSDSSDPFQIQLQRVEEGSHSFDGCKDDESQDFNIFNDEESDKGIMRGRATSRRYYMDNLLNLK
jgi:hypothetical protein